MSKGHNCVGTISYNIYCNFTNYGSALQTWALHQAIRRFTDKHPILVDYCPDVLSDKDPLNPMKNMWDSDEESRRMCQLSMSAIRENYKKFNRFYHERFDRSSIKYTSRNFNSVVDNENLSGFICGSDTIFCIDEFGGFDDGYYANYPIMQGRSVAYAVSFGDSHFSDADRGTLSNRIRNFKAIGIREDGEDLSYVKTHADIPVEQVIDPTLLLTSIDYDTLARPRLEKDRYLLLYSRRYNATMEQYAEEVAQKNKWKIVEISLRATNASKPNRRMFYDAGVEEFLSLVKNAEYVVTNSYHGMIFSIQYKKPVIVFTREQSDSKISYLASLLGMTERVVETVDEKINDSVDSVDYDTVFSKIETHRMQSINFLQMECRLL